MNKRNTFDKKKSILIGSIVGIIFWNIIFIVLDVSTTSSIWIKTLTYGIINGGISASLLGNYYKKIFSSVFMGSIFGSISGSILMLLMKEDDSIFFMLIIGGIIGVFLGSIVGLVIYLINKK